MSLGLMPTFDPIHLKGNQQQRRSFMYPVHIYQGTFLSFFVRRDSVCLAATLFPREEQRQVSELPGVWAIHHLFCSLHTQSCQELPLEGLWADDLDKAQSPASPAFMIPLAGWWVTNVWGNWASKHVLTNTEHMFAVSRMWHFLYPHRATKFSPVSFGCMPNRSFIQWFTIHQTFFWVLCTSAALYCTVVWDKRNI